MKIKLLATSDIHGTITPYKYSDRTLAQQGLTRLSSKIKELRDDTTLLIDNGDVLEGNPLDYHHSLFNRDKMHPMAKALNYLEYDYYNLGNHDFNFGTDMLHRYMDDVHAECLTGNIVENEEAMGADYTLHYFDEEHCIALIGITTQHIPNWEQPKNIVGISFENAFDYVAKTVQMIRENEEVSGIVVVYHGGFEKDLSSGQPTELQTGENLGYAICEKIEGIDVVISGHQHRSLAGKCCGKTITQTAADAKELAYIEWDLETGEIEAQLLAADGPIDQDLMALIQEEEEATQQWLDQPLGRLEEGDLLVHNRLQARIHKHPVISFLNEVQFAFTQADLSSMALFNDAVGFNHEISMRDLVSTYVYPNTLVVLKMSRKVLVAYLEKCAEYFIAEEGEIKVAPNYLAPKPQHFNYDMVDGIEYTIKVSNPIGQRIVALTRNGKEIKENEELTMVMSNYRASGGGDFTMVKDCEVVQEIQRGMVECMAEYLSDHPILKVNHTENIQVIL